MRYIISLTRVIELKFVRGVDLVDSIDNGECEDCGHVLSANILDWNSEDWNAMGVVELKAPMVVACWWCWRDNHP